jgi:hypothetical protein
MLDPNEKWRADGVSDSDESAGDNDRLLNSPLTSELEHLLTFVEECNTRLVRISLISDDPVVHDEWHLNAPLSDMDYDLSWARYRLFGGAQSGSQWLILKLRKTIAARREYLERRRLKMRDGYKPQLTTPFAEVKPLKGFGVTAIAPPNVELSDLCSTKNWESFEEIIGADFSRTGVLLTTCPYCGAKIMINTQKQWEKHVSNDLKPYICTFEDCTWRLFSDCDDWFSHELQYHRREWVCQQCQLDPFSSRDDFVQHLESTHGMGFPSSHLNGVVLKSEEPVDKFYEGACLLCTRWDEMLKGLTGDGVDRPFATAETFKLHLASHLKDVVTMTVPDQEATDRKRQEREQQITRIQNRSGPASSRSAIAGPPLSSSAYYRKSDALNMSHSSIAIASPSSSSADYSKPGSSNMSGMPHDPALSGWTKDTPDVENCFQSSFGIRRPDSTASISAGTRPPSVIDIQDFEPGALGRHTVSRRAATSRASNRSSSTYDSHIYDSIRDDSSNSGWTSRTRSTWTSVGSEYGDGTAIDYAREIGRVGGPSPQRSSDWSWHERGGFYTRTNDDGETEKLVVKQTERVMKMDDATTVPSRSVQDSAGEVPSETSDQTLRSDS